jgi:hypothetical protein
MLRFLAGKTMLIYNIAPSAKKGSTLLGRGFTNPDGRINYTLFRSTCGEQLRVRIRRTPAC